LNQINFPFALLEVNHPAWLEKLVAGTLHSKDTRDILPLELGDILHNRRLQTVAG
jgi:hypothetical protein